MCFGLEYPRTSMLVCAALLGSIACSSDSSKRDPQLPAGRTDASARRDAAPEPAKPGRSARSTHGGPRVPAQEAEVEEPRHDAARGGADGGERADEPDRLAAATAERDAEGPQPDAEAPQLDAGARKLDAGAKHAGETDASLADLSASITKVSVEGTLCPKGSYAADVSGDLAALTLTFSQAEVQTEAGQSLDAKCDVTLQLDVPEGFQFGEFGVRPSGYVFTSERGTTELDLSYAFEPSGTSRTFTHVLSGDRSYAFDDVAAEVWSPTCTRSGSHRNLHFSIALRARARDSAYLSINALDLDLAAVSGTPWRACEFAR